MSTDTVTMDQVLATLGATPNRLTASQRRELDELGYTIIPNLIGPAWLAELREAFERIYHDEGDRAGSEVQQLPGVRRLADLVNKSPVFDGIWLNPHVLAAAQYLAQFRQHSEANPAVEHLLFYRERGGGSPRAPYRRLLGVPKIRGDFRGAGGSPAR